MVKSAQNCSSNFLSRSRTTSGGGKRKREGSRAHLSFAHEPRYTIESFRHLLSLLGDVLGVYEVSDGVVERWRKELMAVEEGGRDQVGWKRRIGSWDQVGK